MFENTGCRIKSGMTETERFRLFTASSKMMTLQKVRYSISFMVRYLTANENPDVRAKWSFCRAGKYPSAEQLH